MRSVDEEVRKLGRAVRALRRSKGWTQARLAEEAGVGRDAVVKLERGAREPRPATLERVGAALGADLFALLRDGALRHVPGLRPSRGKDEPRGQRGEASRPESAPGTGEERWTLEKILGGTEPLAEALERARGAAVWEAGMADEKDAPGLPAGEGAVDEIVAQRRMRYY